MRKSYLGRISRYAHTLRHLKPSQLAWRIWHQLPKPLPAAGAVPPARPATGVWRAPIEKPVAVLSPTRLRFLNQEETLSFPEGWNDPRFDKLWLYNLHYFDDLSAEGGAEHANLGRALVERWVRENPAPFGNGWDPYPTSLRLVNWLKRLLAGDEASSAVMASIAQQTRALEQRVERHLLANHLLANGKALTFAGLCFGAADGERWLRKGMAILEAELEEQILADGGHIERSPMYHAIILEDLLDLINLATARPGVSVRQVEDWIGKAGKMRLWLAAMSHPDQDIAFFNDCALEIAPKPRALEAYARRLGLPELPAQGRVVDLAASGYVRLQAGAFTLLFDAAPVGPDYQPGHAHADTLSLELSVGTHRLLVNTGVSTYQLGPRRAAERATAAHNTIEIDHTDSSETWAAFRVARRARILTRSVQCDGEETIVEASHDGYRRLRGRPVHRRTIRCTPDRVAIQDAISGAFHNATARYRLNPGLTAVATGACEGVVMADGRPIAVWSSTKPVQLNAAVQATAFNVREPCVELRFDLDERPLEVIWRPAG